MLITPVILCGGSGTRLWPLSRKSFPKQFVPLIGEKSLLQLTLERLAGISASLICVASEEHRFLVAQAMQSAQVQGTVLLEPVARNTAAAMTIAALSAAPVARPPARETGDVGGGLETKRDRRPLRTHPANGSRRHCAA